MRVAIVYSVPPFGWMLMAYIDSRERGLAQTDAMGLAVRVLYQPLLATTLSDWAVVSITVLLLACYPLFRRRPSLAGRALLISGVGAFLWGLLGYFAIMIIVGR